MGRLHICTIYLHIYFTINTRLTLHYCDRKKHECLENRNPCALSSNLMDTFLQSPKAGQIDYSVVLLKCHLWLFF